MANWGGHNIRNSLKNQTKLSLTAKTDRKAYICVTFAAYKVYKELERQLAEKKSKISPTKAIYIAENIMEVTIQLPQNGNLNPKWCSLLMNKNYSKSFLILGVKMRKSGKRHWRYKSSHHKAIIATVSINCLNRTQVISGVMVIMS